MNGFVKLAVAFLLAIPAVAPCETEAYSPSISGQPLIFQVNSIGLSQFSAAEWTQLQNALLIRSSYSRHLESHSCSDCCCGGWDVWADGMGQWLKQDSGNQNHFGYRSATGGLTLGADTCCNDLRVGVAVSYTHSNLHWEKRAGNSQINSYYGGLYGSWNNGCFYIDTALLGAYSDYSTTRHKHYRTYSRHAHSHHHSGEFLTGFEAGYLWQECCCIDFVPFVGLDYVYLSRQGHSEHGALSSNLHVGSHSDQLLQSEVGLQLRRCFNCDCNWTVAPNLSISYINQSPLSGRSCHVKYVGRNHGYRVKGWDFERNLGAIAFGFNFLDCSGMSGIGLYYDGQFGKNYWNQTGGITGHLSF